MSLFSIALIASSVFAAAITIIKLINIIRKHHHSHLEKSLGFSINTEPAVRYDAVAVQDENLHPNTTTATTTTRIENSRLKSLTIISTLILIFQIYLGIYGLFTNNDTKEVAVSLCWLVIWVNISNISSTYHHHYVK